MFFSLLAGLIMAFAFQLLLTSLEVALGLSFAGWALAPSDATDEPADSSSSSTEPISHILGAGVAFSLAVVLFATSFLTVQFSGFDQPRTGLIFGTILWAAYLLTLSWISSVAVSSILGAVLGTAAAGIRRLFSAIGQTVSSNQADLSDTDKLQIITSELSEAIASQQQLPELLSQQREQLLAEISERTQLPIQQAEAILAELRAVQEKKGEEKKGKDGKENGEVEDWETGARELGKESATGGEGLAGLLPDWRGLLRLVRQRVDFSDWDIETIWRAFQSLEGYGKNLPFNIVSLDVEDYLMEIPRWALRAEVLPQAFAERLYDPEADPGQVEAQLRALKRSDFVHWLKQRGDLSEETVEAMAERLGAVYSSVVETVQQEVASSGMKRWQQRLSDQLDKLPLETFSADDLKSWLQDSVDYMRSSVSDAEDIQNALTQLDSGAVAGIFERYPMLKPEQKEDFIRAFEQGRGSILEQFEKQQTAISEALMEIQTKLLAYFRYTRLDKLTADAVEEKVHVLKSTARDQLAETALFKGLTEDKWRSLLNAASFDKVDNSSAESLSKFDLVAEAIARRNGITTAQQNELTTALTAAWIGDQPTAEASSAKDEAFYSSLIHTLQTVDWPDVSLENIKPELTDRISDLLNHLPQVPPQIDTSRVVEALSLPVSVRSEVKDWLQQSQREWLKLPRRWTQRTVHTSEDWGNQLKSQISDYLQHEEKSALQPSQLLASVSGLVKSTVRSLSALPTELPHLDLAFLEEALSARPDLSEQEREQIAEKLTSVWQTLSHSMTDWEDEIQSTAQMLKQFVSRNVDDIGSTLSSGILESARQQVVEAFERAQETVALQTASVKHELKQQAEQVRQQIAIAAWWLFISLLTSGMASAGAGWLAVRFSAA